MLKLRLRQILLDRDYQLQQLAEDIGITKGHLTRYSTNKMKNLPVDLINRICNKLDVTPAELFFYKKD